MNLFEYKVHSRRDIMIYLQLCMYTCTLIQKGFEPIINDDLTGMVLAMGAVCGGVVAGLSLSFFLPSSYTVHAFTHTHTHTHDKAASVASWACYTTLTLTPCGAYFSALLCSVSSSHLLLWVYVCVFVLCFCIHSNQIKIH